MRRVALALTIGVLVAIGQASGAIIVHTTDFINNADRTHFNGFENIPILSGSGFYAYNGSVPYVEDGIQVQQVNGDPGNDIWVSWVAWGAEGQRAWYPNSGDHGYTKITLADGSDFENVGFLRGSGGSPVSSLSYELYEDGALILFGSVPQASAPASYLGFSGGGFDEIRVHDDWFNSNSLAIDSIETSGAATVAEPATLVIWSLLGAAGIGLTWWRKRTARVT